MPERRGETSPAMWPRILKVLSIGLKHGHDAIVPGAWGWGVFGNDGREIAELFHRALEVNFKGSCGQVVFAIVDSSRDQRFIGPFRKVFQVISSRYRFGYGSHQLDRKPGTRNHGPVSVLHENVQFEETLSYG